MVNEEKKISCTFSQELKIKIGLEVKYGNNKKKNETIIKNGGIVTWKKHVFFLYHSTLSFFFL